jgi:hypothetical protein
MKVHGWTVWLKTHGQRLAAFTVLLMALLGILGGHQHTHHESPTESSTTIIIIGSASASGGNSGAAAVMLPRLSVQAKGMVFPVDTSLLPPSL